MDKYSGEDLLLGLYSIQKKAAEAKKEQAKKNAKNAEKAWKAEKEAWKNVAK